MKLDRWLLSIALLLFAACDKTPIEAPQGFAGLGQEAGQYAQVVRGRQFKFPRDYGPHDGYRIEWWYITANLKDQKGRDWGMQWTLFRSALRAEEDQDGWGSPNVWMGHAALTGPDGHRYAQTLARGGVGQAGVNAKPFKAWIDDWVLQASQDRADLGIQRLSLQVRAPDFGYQLELRTDSAPVLHGEGGYSQKSGKGQASYYYSQPFYEISGKVQMNGQAHVVSGRAWMDREWSSQPLTADQQGWDWFSLHLDSGHKLMLFQVRHTDGGHYRAGTWIAADGQSVTLQPQQIWMQPQEWTRLDNGRRVPTQWHLQVPDHNIDVIVSALEPQAWMETSFPYWEGPVKIAGSAKGRGYLEMTGY